MEVVKKTNRYVVFKKRSGRYGVRSAGGAWINGDEKTKILLDEGLIEAPPVKKEAEQKEVEESSDEAKDESSEEAGDQNLGATT